MAQTGTFSLLWVFVLHSDISGTRMFSCPIRVKTLKLDFLSPSHNKTETDLLRGGRGGLHGRLVLFEGQLAFQAGRAPAESRPRFEHQQTLPVLELRGLWSHYRQRYVLFIFSRTNNAFFFSLFPHLYASGAPLYGAHTLFLLLSADFYSCTKHAATAGSSPCSGGQWPCLPAKTSAPSRHYKRFKSETRSRKSSLHVNALDILFHVSWAVKCWARGSTFGVPTSPNHLI